MNLFAYLHKCRFGEVHPDITTVCTEIQMSTGGFAIHNFRRERVIGQEPVAISDRQRSGIFCELQ
jgi:hypothetical protein